MAALGLHEPQFRALCPSVDDLIRPRVPFMDGIPEGELLVFDERIEASEKFGSVQHLAPGDAVSSDEIRHGNRHYMVELFESYTTTATLS